ncbi:hypothetical protein D3C79_931070 [compost metagenome]
MMSTSASRMRSMTSRYRFTSRLKRPVCGSRTWQWTTVAPALAASTADSAICLGVTGTRWLLATVSPAPVRAQVMMTSWFMVVPCQGCGGPIGVGAALCREGGA